MSQSLQLFPLALLVLLCCVAWGGVEAAPRLFARSTPFSQLLNASIRERRASLLEAASSANEVLPKSRLKFRRVPEDVVTVSRYDSIVLECEAGGNPPPTIHWLKNGRPIQQDKKTEWMDQPTSKPAIGVGITRSRFYVDCATPEDDAVYTCVAETPYQRIAKETKVRVLSDADSATLNEIRPNTACVSKRSSSFASHGSPPRITMWTHSRLEMIGTNVQLFCRSNGQPKPNIMWYGPEDTELVNTEKYRVLENGDLEIRHIVWGDMGDYTCVSENAHGTDKSSTFLYPALPEKN